MYQTSLSSFITMFDHCIDASERAADVGIRLRLLSTFALHFMFDQLQRGLFEQHKLLFSFMLATATARAAGKVTQVCYYTLFGVHMPASTLASSSQARIVTVRLIDMELAEVHSCVILSVM